MNNNQTDKTADKDKPLNLPPKGLNRVSTFDKKGQAQLLTESNFSNTAVKGSGAPQFRINQHKGA